MTRFMTDIGGTVDLVVALKRIANCGTFAISAAVLGPFLVKKPDVLYAYHPPGTIGLAAVAVKARFHTPIVYDIQDMWPDTIAATAMLVRNDPPAKPGVTL